MINKKEDILVNNELKKSILNKFISISTTELLNQYLNTYIFYKNIPEDVFKYLDGLVYLMQIENKFSISNNLIKVNAKQKRKFEKAFAKAKEIEPLFQRLNILFNIIKNEDLQNELFIKLINDFAEYGNKITKNQENNNKIINEFIDKSTKDKIKELIIRNNNQLEYVYK